MAEVVLMNVTKTFGQTRAVAGVDLTIRDGEFFSLLGPSGCGKSTILGIICGLVAQDAGTISIQGREVSRLSPKERGVAMVFQDYALYPHMTVFENLAFPLRADKVGKAEMKRRIAVAAAPLEIEALLGRYPRELSGGQRQRVALGRALVREPALFLMDEPLSNLDARLRAQMRVELRLLQQRLGATILYVTHDQAEAMTLSDRLGVMAEGRIQQVGVPMEVYEHPRTRFVASFLGDTGMNLLPGFLARDEGGAAWRSQTLRWPLTPAQARACAQLVDGHPLELAFRPETVSLATAPGECWAVSELVLREELGSEQHLHLELDGCRLIARVDPHVDVNDASRVPIALRARSVHVIDGETGVRIDARENGQKEAFAAVTDGSHVHVPAADYLLDRNAEAQSR